MHSKKLKDISNTSLTRVSSFLSELYTSDVARFSLSDVVKGAEVSRLEAYSVIEHLIEENIIKPQIEVRCPQCDQREGRYNRKSDVPNQSESEFCGHSFDTKSEDNWDIVYKFEGELESDFFRSSVIV